MSDPARFEPLSERIAAEVKRQLGLHGAGGDDGGMDRFAALEQRVGRLEDILQPLSVRVAEVHGMLSAALPTLATKAELADLAGKTPTKAYLWMVVEFWSPPFSRPPSRGRRWDRSQAHFADRTPRSKARPDIRQQH